MLINPSSQLIIDGLCKEGCGPDDSVEYNYKVYSGSIINSIDLSWTPFVDNLGLLPGM
jgi:hypothetical protein